MTLTDRPGAIAPDGLELHRRLTALDRRRTMPNRTTRHTVEDYARAILQISLESDAATVRTGDLAKRLDVTDGTASRMVRILSEAGVAVFTPYEGAQLTEKGQRVAAHALRKHRLIELFLAEALGIEWDAVDEEAERLEHAVSEQLIERIDQFLGFPEEDPHGDPIPRGDGSLPATYGVSLAACDNGVSFVIRRILDQRPGTLQFLASVGARPGQAGLVVKNSPVAGIVSIQLDGHTVSLSRAVAAKVFVAPAV
jgi:DtxR family Mn-dependent transcriptional regulator